MDSFSPQIRSWIMSRVKASGNRSTEEALKRIFKRLRITGWRRSYPLFGKPDFVFRAAKVAVFVDGCFWHGHPTKCRIPKANRAYWLRKISRNRARQIGDPNATKARLERIRIWQ